MKLLNFELIFIFPGNLLLLLVFNKIFQILSFSLQKPLFWWVDDLSLADAILSVFPDATIKLDLFHALDRVSRECPDGHSLMPNFIREIRSCLLVPYDTELVKECEKQRGAPAYEGYFKTAAFIDAYNSRGGRW